MTSYFYKDMHMQKLHGLTTVMATPDEISSKFMLSW